MITHSKLTKLLKKAYSAEMAAAYAYQGHAANVNNFDVKAGIVQIEKDEWEHRDEVLKIMQEYQIKVSKFYEVKYALIGKVISISCYLLGKFIPNYFAGRLESGNVCEYFRMKHYFNQLGIYKHDQVLFDMGIKEKEHEAYFLKFIINDKRLPFFEKFFKWGKCSFNNVDLDNLLPIEESELYCK